MQLGRSYRRRALHLRQQLRSRKLKAEFSARRKIPARAFTDTAVNDSEKRVVDVNHLHVMLAQSRLNEG